MAWMTRPLLPFGMMERKENRRDFGAVYSVVKFLSSFRIVILLSI